MHCERLLHTRRSLHTPYVLTYITSNGSKICPAEWIPSLWGSPGVRAASSIFCLDCCAAVKQTLKSMPFDGGLEAVHRDGLKHSILQGSGRAAASVQPMLQVVASSVQSSGPRPSCLEPGPSCWLASNTVRLQASGSPAAICQMNLQASLQCYSAAAGQLCCNAPLLSWPVCRRSRLLSARAAHLAWLRVSGHHEAWRCSRQEGSQCAGGCLSQGSITATDCSWIEQKDFRRRVFLACTLTLPMPAIMQQGLTCSLDGQDKDPQCSICVSCRQLMQSAGS